MGELKTTAESLNRELNEIYKELYDQREKLGTVMSRVKDFAEKGEKIEKENEDLKKQLASQQK